MSIRTMQRISLQNPNLWEFYIDGSPDIKFYVTEVSLPFKKFETETRKTGSKHITSFIPEEEISITFKETTRWEIMSFLEKWQDDIYNNAYKTFRSGKSRNKYRTGILAFERTVTPFHTKYNKVYELSRMQLKGIDDLSLNYENSGPLLISAQFAVDEVKLRPAVGVNISIGAVSDVGAAINTAESVGNFLNI